MSKIKERIEEIERITRKSRRINNTLWVLVAIFVLASIGLGFYASAKAEEANDAKILLNDANEQLVESEKELQRKLDSMVRVSVGDLWQGAKTINTLKGYSSYKAQNPNDSIHGEDLIRAVNNLLNKSGYVQLIETNGNKLFEKVDLALDGDFVKFNTDINVRNGAIGIDDCGSSNPTKTGVLVNGKTVRIKNRCEASGSESVWALIEYAQ
ncbi:hypothetical protein [Lentiprolixibacter aurantiacus]|uniref:Uncharacterized protein n=1 Tax=Lentiprolixibacter aurantiacus TaxID=2993939 RepID=A0AAE3MMG5_9FLAO|nr:hypothetical protein [Lentiprolixibacter aurantiacus]MCX2719918.1 hypothetical protein [Lentiprolixibacter aurantiacus]